MTIGRAVRQNAFLVAAVALPLLVVLFFLGASLVPRWFVAPPAYDLLLKVAESYSGQPLQSRIEFKVEDGRVIATASRPEKDAFVQPWGLYLFEQGDGAAHKVTVDLPKMLPEGESERTVVVTALGSRRVIAQQKAPDGYELQSASSSSGPLVGEIFGMRSHDWRLAIAKNGRVVKIALPPTIPYYYGTVDVVGWLER